MLDDVPAEAFLTRSKSVTLLLSLSIIALLLRESNEEVDCEATSSLARLDVDCICVYRDQIE
jgi:hypothetical protein